ncbi:unnamed protein product [Sphagnum troendelagicum]
MSRWEVGKDDRWRQPSRDPPSLHGEFACASLPRSQHLAGSLSVAGSASAWLAFFPPLLSELPERKVLGTEGASREPCAGGSEDPLAIDEISLLVKEEARVPLPSLGFDLLHLNLPRPCRASRLAFRILLATRKNSLRLEI